MDSKVNKIIKMLDSKAANFGFSQNNKFGLTNDGQLVELSSGQILNPAVDLGNAELMTMENVNMGRPVRNVQPVNYTINKSIQTATAGADTFMITIDVNKVGNGSGNTKNPVWLFGGDAYKNTARPYATVLNAGQIASVSFVDTKNVIIFKYENAVNPETNYSEYTISLGTSGEYPFILNSLSGENMLKVLAMQLEISDVNLLNQLTAGMNTFKLDEFGKATTNDLTTPKDLYQQQSNGLYIPHKYPISGKEGLQLQVLESDGLNVKYYFYIGN